MKTTTSEVLEKAEQLAMEVRIAAGQMMSSYRRGNGARLRHAHRMAKALARLAACLSATAFEATDLLDAQLRELRNRAEE